MGVGLTVMLVLVELVSVGTVFDIIIINLVNWI